MARQLPAGCLTAARGDGRFSYRSAGNADAEAINALLAATPLGGAFSVTMERGPDPLQADFGLSSNHLIVLGHDRRSSELAGMCERAVYPAFVNGTASALPYLGALRVAPEFRNRLHVVRGGFDAVRRLGERPGDLPFALTSITADNARAMRLLTAGLPGLPRYRPAGAYSTLVLRARRRRMPPAIRRARAADLPAIAALLNRENARFQFAPVWTPQALASLSTHGLAPGHFLIAGDGARLTGCIAAWDQSARRQAVVHAYPKPLGALRPLWNLAAPLTGLPRLPRTGEPLKQVALSHCAAEGGDPQVFTSLVDAALADAAARGFDSGFIGLAASNPLAAQLKRLRRTIEYRTELHTVHWPDQPEPDLDPALPAQPEAGLL